MSENPKNIKLIIQFLMLLLLLVIFPIGTYFWMKGGTDYRRERLSQLEDLGKLNNLGVYDINGDVINLEDAKDQMILTAFLPEDRNEAKKLVDRISLLENQLEVQLDQRKDILFLLLTALENNEDIRFVESDLNLKDQNKLTLASAGKEHLKSLAVNSFKIPLEQDQNVFKSNILSLVDLQGVVRSHYDAMNNQEMGNLVEHIAIILPKDERKDIYIKKETEK